MHQNISVAGYFPIDPALLKYLEWRDAIPPNVPVEVPGRTGIASLIEALVGWVFVFCDERGMRYPDPVITDRFEARLYFNLRGPLARHEVFYFADRLAIQINKVLYQEAQADIIRLVMEGKKRKKQEKDTIDQFLRLTGMDEHWDFEAVKKAQYRARQDRGGVQVRGYSWALEEM